MGLKKHFERPYRSLAVLVVLVLLSFLGLEGWLYSIKPAPVNRDDPYKNSLNRTVEIFNRSQKTLLDDTRELAEQLEGQIQGQQSRQRLYQSIQQYNSFWGVTLFNKNNVPRVWDGFSFSEYPDQLTSTDEEYVDIYKQNNVTLLLCKIEFTVTDSSGVIPYEIITSKRVEQKNALPIGKDQEYSLLSEHNQRLGYPIELSFFDSQPPSMLDYEVLSTVSRDSVGIAYVSGGKTGNPMSEWENSTWFWRSVFSVIAYLALSLFFYLWFDKKRGWPTLFYQLGIVGTVWLLFSLLSIPDQWLLSFSDSIEPDLSLSSFARRCVFIFLLAFTLSRYFRRRNDKFKHSSFLRTLSLGILLGLVNVVVILSGIIQIHSYLTVTGVQLFDLQIFPSASTLILYLSVGLLLFSVGYLLSSLGFYLLRLEREQEKLVITITIPSFVIGLLISQLYLPSHLTMNWAFTLSMAYFGGTFLLAILQNRYRRLFDSFSLLRSLAMYSFFISLMALPILKNAQYVRIDNRLIDQAKSFLNEDDLTARSITEQVLTTLENEFNGITNEDLEQRVPFLQSKFTQTIEQIITPEWRSYSLNLQLIKPEGTLIADYSTDLNAPNWTNVFDLVYLSAATDIERITKTSNRPIIQMPDLENSENYDTFYRGWIPIFSAENNDQIAWILCSVYREHPEFNKPIRAVLASLTYTEWQKPYLLLEYNNGDLVRSNKRGVVGRFPKYNVLRQAEQRAIAQDSTNYYTVSENQRTYRNLLWVASDGRVIKASTIYPDIKNLLFNFFRFSFTLLLAGLVIIPIIFAITHSKLVFWGSSKRFEHRILDSFLLATLLFLGLLIVTTHFAIKEQNKEIVRQDLFDKLDELATNTENNIMFRRSLQSDTTSFTLESLTSPLNLDAAYYEDRLLKESTTPQIYQQHLVPSTLPFEVYNDLYINQRKESVDNINLASQNLLIGYHSLLSPEDRPVGAIAIPTFVQSPKYDQQLLETTSYLIVFYLFTFGVFVLATAIISKQITRPLRSIQMGLNRISKGELDTTIPVKSDDEIGLLAEAYNNMVERLKEVREELSVAEREAAWQEMAQQVAHEIKNPLTPMKLNVQHLERQISGNSQSMEELKSTIRKITKNLIEQIQTLNNIASDFSKFSKPINEEFIKVNANEILRSVADLYQHDKGIVVKTELTEYPIFVKAVPDELKRVFINLLKNSFEAMPEEGGKIILKSFIKEGSAFFEVDDDGTGIPEKDKSKIFVPNFSTKSSGTGLGLAICRKVIDAHGGTITFASIEGTGTTFIIKMPLYKS